MVHRERIVHALLLAKHTHTPVHTLADTLMCVCVCGPLFVVAVDFSSLAAAAHTMLDKLISNNLILLSISGPCTALRHRTGAGRGRGVDRGRK